MGSVRSKSLAHETGRVVHNFPSWLTGKGGVAGKIPSYKIASWLTRTPCYSIPKNFESGIRSSVGNNFGLWCLPQRHLHNCAILSLCSIDKGIHVRLSIHTCARVYMETTPKVFGTLNGQGAWISCTWLTSCLVSVPGVLGAVPVCTGGRTYAEWPKAMLSSLVESSRAQRNSQWPRGILSGLQVSSMS